MLKQKLEDGFGKVFLDNNKQSRYNILMKKFKRCKKYEKFSMAKWTERRNAQYKRDSDMVWFMLKHPITWMLGAMVAMVIIESFK
jgi:hypothetical protein